MIRVVLELGFENRNLGVENFLDLAPFCISRFPILAKKFRFFLDSKYNKNFLYFFDCFNYVKHRDHVLTIIFNLLTSKTS